MFHPQLKENFLRKLNPYDNTFIYSISSFILDLKLHLQSTDYGNFLANVPSPLQVSVIDDQLREKLVTEFQHMRNHSSGQLATFLDFITYSYMIDNIILLITGTLHQRPISELVTKCHPLGSFEQMEAIHVASTPAELYNAVLVDTPLGKGSFEPARIWSNPSLLICFVFIFTQLPSLRAVSTSRIWMRWTLKSFATLSTRAI